MISILATLVFPIIQVGINYAFQWFKYKDIGRNHSEEKRRAENEYDILNIRTGNQERQGLQNHIDTLINEKQALLDQVGSLNSKVSSLSQKEEELKNELAAKTNKIKELTVKNKVLSEKDGKENSTIIEMEFDSILEKFQHLIYFLREPGNQSDISNIKFFFETIVKNNNSFKLQAYSQNLSLDFLMILKNKLLELKILEKKGVDLYTITPTGRIILKQFNTITKNGTYIINNL